MLMSDRFKFRVWDNERNKYHNTDDVIDNNGVLGCTAWTVGFVRYKDGLCVVEQCTGLKDKNGKLIYEGDLIKEPANKYPLEIYYGKGAWETREYRKNGNNEQLLYCLINCYGVEVIGNIHENADLLGEQTDEPQS